MVRRQTILSQRNRFNFYQGPLLHVCPLFPSHSPWSCLPLQSAVNEGWNANKSETNSPHLYYKETLYNTNIEPLKERYVAGCFFLNAKHTKVLTYSFLSCVTLMLFSYLLDFCHWYSRWAWWWRETFRWKEERTNDTCCFSITGKPRGKRRKVTRRIITLLIDTFIITDGQHKCSAIRM